MQRLSRRDILKTGLVSVGAGLPGLAAAGAASVPPVPSFHFDHVLGTSLDVWATGATPLQRVEDLVLGEIERLRRIFSTCDPDSELSRLNRATGPVPASADLCAVLREYEVWQMRTSGALSAQLGDLVRLWQGTPNAALLAHAVAAVRRPGWVIDPARGTVTRTTEQSLNLNSVAKGYIIHRAAAAVRERCPEVTALLLNLGGDMAGWGNEFWRIGVQNPCAPAENARPLTSLVLHNRAVATSGGYQRYSTVDGVRRSHLIDPRTGRPASDVAGATVVAPTSTLANLLATSLCILAPAEGLRLIANTPEAECLIVTATGQQVRSTGFAALELPVVAVQEPKAEAKPGEWIEGRQVTIALELVKPTTGRAIRRPYVAVWIEDGDGNAVRTLAVWGNGKWLNTLTNWWKSGKPVSGTAVTRATRAPGKYELVWDGKDDKGKPVAQGTYTIRVETHREHGKHTLQTGKIACAGEDTKVTLEKNAEAEATLVQYAMKK